ncbi:GW dipeptide domain-containing protein [Kurthia senegalensis]|uniref:GW dipeptide domain-containing protein n=1 Tax=Kurthia senegalensis TaxID=1033740 RepID=UPI000288415C|nr:GW dipeptide domain-containing protein [Kurthia senegalensis]
MKGKWKAVAATGVAASIVGASFVLTEHTAQAATVKTTDVSYIAKVKNTTQPIYTKVGDTKPKMKAGTAYTNTALYVYKKAVVSGTTYYQLSNAVSKTAAPIGWVKAASVQVQTLSYPKSDQKVRTFNGTEKGYTRPNGMSKNILFKSLATYKNKTMKTLSIAKVGKETWYYGLVGGQGAWFKASSFTKVTTTTKEPAKPTVSKAVAVSYVGKVKAATSSLFKLPTDSKASMTAGKSYTDEVFYIQKKQVVNGVTFYELKRSQTGATIAWAKAADVTVQSYKVVKNTTKSFTLLGTGKGYTRADGGARNVLLTTLTTYKGKTFTPSYVATVGKATWYYGKVGTANVWLAANQLKAKAATTPKPEEKPAEDKPTTSEPIVIVESSVSKIGKVLDAETVVIADLTKPTVTKKIAATYVNQAAIVTKRATMNKKTYYYMPKVGWVEEANMTLQKYTAAKAYKKTLSLVGKGKGYSLQGGTSKQVKKSLNVVAGQDFFVTKSAVVGTTTWYYGTDQDGDRYWTAKSNTIVKVTPSIEAANLHVIMNAPSVTLYPDVNDLATSQKMTTVELMQVYKVSRKATTPTSVVYYELTYNGVVIGWVAAADVKNQPTTTQVSNTASLFLNGVGKGYSEAGERGQLVYSTLAANRKDGFIPLDEKTVGGVVYYKGVVGTKIVWVGQGALSNPYLVVDLRKVSNITQEEMEKYLVRVKGDAIKSNDLYKAIPAILDVQKTYGINAQFILAHMIAETGWGTSKISQYKHNGFGYQAYDSCAMTCAAHFPSVVDGLPFYANKIYTQYLKASGPYYNGTSVSDINVRYATDKNWSVGIARNMRNMKEYDAAYYAKQPVASVNPPAVTTKVTHIIPSNQPQPETFRTFKKAFAATAKSATVYYKMPYATTANKLGTAKAGDTINVEAYHDDVRDSGSSRWFRTTYNGTQAWVLSSTMTIPYLATATSTMNVLKTADSVAGVKVVSVTKTTHLRRLVDANGAVMTKKDTKGISFTNVTVAHTGQTGWIETAKLRTFE